MKKTRYLHGDERFEMVTWVPEIMFLGGTNFTVDFTEEEAADERRLYAIALLLRAAIENVGKQHVKLEGMFEDLFERKRLYLQTDFLQLNRDRDYARRFMIRVCSLLLRLPTEFYQRLPEDVPQYEADVRSFMQGLKEDLEQGQNFTYRVV